VTFTSTTTPTLTTATSTTTISTTTTTPQINGGVGKIKGIVTKTHDNQASALEETGRLSVYIK
jgi:hypothetical protein